ncbi:MAG: hypothetical protein D3906_18450 [Candidatus Electrothrix sp. AUS1_2]|nr:hypothetical protein [Candidatus Electrothrix sp. AUS1_2]
MKVNVRDPHFRTDYCGTALFRHNRPQTERLFNRDRPLRLGRIQYFPILRNPQKGEIPAPDEVFSLFALLLNLLRCAIITFLFAS